MDIKRMKRWRLITKNLAEADESADRLVRRWSALVKGGDVGAEMEEDLRRQARLVVDHYWRATYGLSEMMIDIKASHEDVMYSAEKDIHKYERNVQGWKEFIEEKVDELLLQRRRM